MSETHAIVADLFRREAGRLTALLASRVGAARIDLVEDAVQDALIAAMRSWPIHGTPANPPAWLYTAARNAMTDRLRRALFEKTRVDPIDIPTVADDRFAAEDTLSDELLRLIAYCCHPLLSPGAQLALTLRLACGLSVAEIADALLAEPAAIAQRIARAKKELRSAGVELDVAPHLLIAERLPGVLNAVYLLFNAGYLSTQHEEWLRPALCADALRLSRLLAAHTSVSEPETHALAALLHFAAARMPARSDAEGRPVPLALQDRSRWDQSLIARGFMHFDASIAGETVTRYHIEAAIAASHARAADMESTDWIQILGLYDQLCTLYPGPAATLNRIIALRYARGAQEAFASIATSQELDSVQDSLVYHATIGDLHASLGAHERAAQSFANAAALAGSSTLAAMFRERERAARGMIDSSGQ